MSRIIVTGSTGNTGQAVIAALLNRKARWQGLEIVAAIRDAVDAVKPVTQNDLEFIQFDFEHLHNELKRGDRIFLLRPPALADVKKTFLPFVEMAVRAEVAHIVFISVQGAEKSKFIPHHGIEQLIIASKIPYTFLRNAYFMQNLTTTLLADVLKTRELFVPAGKAKFNWVDVTDIGEVAAEVLLQPSMHLNKAYELTGKENLDFSTVAALLTTLLNKPVYYNRPSLLKFYLQKQKEGVKPAFILVMMFLHYIPNFIPEPKISGAIKAILDREPGTLHEFIEHNLAILNS